MQKSVNNMEIKKSICIYINCNESQSLSCVGPDSDIFVIHPQSEAYCKLKRYVSECSFIHKSSRVGLYAEADFMAVDFRLGNLSNSVEMVFWPDNPQLPNLEFLLQQIKEMVCKYNVPPHVSDRISINFGSISSQSETNDIESLISSQCIQEAILDKTVFLSLHNMSSSATNFVSLATKTSLSSFEIFDCESEAWIPCQPIQCNNTLAVPPDSTLLIKKFCPHAGECGVVPPPQSTLIRIADMMDRDHALAHESLVSASASTNVMGCPYSP